MEGVSRKIGRLFGLILLRLLLLLEGFMPSVDEKPGSGKRVCYEL